MITTLQSFDRKGWISRFGKALEDTAATARPHWVPFRMYGQIDRDLYRREQYRRYRGMAELAKTDPYAAKLFDESHLWLDSLPDGVLDLLLEHPVIEHAWSRGSREAFHFVQVLGGGHADVKFLITNLAKLSVKVGGKPDGGAKTGTGHLGVIVKSCVWTHQAATLFPRIPFTNVMFSMTSPRRR